MEIDKILEFFFFVFREKIYEEIYVKLFSKF